MSGEVLVTDAKFQMTSGAQYMNSSRITLDGSAYRYMNGHNAFMAAQIYDTIFTDNNLEMYIMYALVDNGGWYSVGHVAWEAVNGTASRTLNCPAEYAANLRWAGLFNAYGGDGKTYVDWAYMTAYSARQLEAMSPGSTRGKYLYHLASWNFTTGFPNLQLNHGTLLNTTCGIVVF